MSQLNLPRATVADGGEQGVDLHIQALLTFLLLTARDQTVAHRLRMPTNCHAYMHLYAYIDCETIFHPDYSGRVGCSRV